MARIRNFIPGTQVIKEHPTETDCYYQKGRSGSGQAFLHLSTFGSDMRETKAKSSQSLQLDKVRATQLIRIFIEAFGQEVLP